MNIPVYEIKDGEGYNGFTKVVTASVTPIRNGIESQVQSVRIRRVAQRYKDYTAQLPCNYNTLDNVTLQQLLDATEYGKLYVSSTGTSIINKIKG